MAAANAQIGVANAAFYPSIVLGPQFGFQSRNFSTLFDAPSTIWALGVSILQPIFTAHLCLCLQLAQSARGRCAMRHHFHPARQARRRAGRDRAGNLAQRPFRIHDISVKAGDVVIAEFRGHSRAIAGTWLPVTDAKQ